MRNLIDWKLGVLALITYTHDLYKERGMYQCPFGLRLGKPGKEKKKLGRLQRDTFVNETTHSGGLFRFFKYTYSYCVLLAPSLVPSAPDRHVDGRFVLILLKQLSASCFQLDGQGWPAGLFLIFFPDLLRWWVVRRRRES